MLEGMQELTLELLNEATQAWVEREYHRALHSELGCTPPFDRLRTGLSGTLQAPMWGVKAPAART